ETLNEQVGEFMRKRDFISIFYGILNHKEHSFVYTNCGHNPALHFTSHKINLLEGGDPSLNIIKGLRFKTFKIELRKSDQILFYTDGGVEVFSKDKKQFGLKRLINEFQNISNNSPSEIIQHLISSTKNYSGSGYFDAFFTLLILKRTN